MRIAKGELMFVLDPWGVGDGLRPFGRRKFLTPEEAFDAGVRAEDLLDLLLYKGNQKLAVRMVIAYAELVADLAAPEAAEVITAAKAALADPSERALQQVGCLVYCGNSAYKAAWFAACATYQSTDCSYAYGHARDAAARAGRELPPWIDIFNQCKGTPK